MVPAVPKEFFITEMKLGVRSKPFRAYISTDPEGVSTDSLTGYYRALRKHPHPALRYAAGCAIADAALSIRTRWASDKRQAALNSAEEAWADAEQMIPLSHDAFETEQQYLSFLLKTRISRSDLPILREVTQVIGGDSEEFSPTAVEQTKHSISTISESLLLTKKDSTRRGISIELATRLLLAQFGPEDIVAVNGLFAAENHFGVDIDLFRLTTDGLRRAGLQVKGKRRRNPYKEVARINERTNLKFTGLAPRNTNLLKMAINLPQDDSNTGRIHRHEATEIVNGLILPRLMWRDYRITDNV